MALGFMMKISKAAYAKVMKKSRGRGQRSKNLTNRDRSVIEMYRFQQRKKASPFTAYLKGSKVTNWTGLKMCTVTKRSSGRSGFVTFTGQRPERVTVEARCIDGHKYVGRGPGDGMYLRLTPKKGRR